MIEDWTLKLAPFGFFGNHRNSQVRFAKGRKRDLGKRTSAGSVLCGQQLQGPRTADPDPWHVTLSEHQRIDLQPERRAPRQCDAEASRCPSSGNLRQLAA